LEVGARSSFELKFVLLQKPQTSSNDLGLVVKSASSDKTLNHLIKMRSYGFTHVRRLQLFGTVVKNFTWPAIEVDARRINLGHWGVVRVNSSSPSSRDSHFV